MDNNEQRAWTAVERQAELDRLGFGSICKQPLSKPGIPDCFRAWTNADKAAFAFLMATRPGDADALCAAFPGLQYHDMGDEEYEQVAEDAQGVANLFCELQNIVQKFELAIRKRWWKKYKSTKSRIDLLNRAWESGELPTSHRPDLGLIDDLLADRQRMDDELAVNMSLCPHINLEDLAHGDTMLRFLNSRARHEPSVFALHDLETTVLPKRVPLIPLAFAPRKIDLSSPVSSGLYGKVHTFSRKDVDDIIRGRAFSVADGMLVLEIQAYTLYFLVKFCKLILHDMVDKLDDDSVPVQPEPDPPPMHDEPTDSIIYAAAQMPYRVPRSCVELSELLDLARAAFEDAKEHIWALREDPSYFSTMLKDFMSHSETCIPDTRGRFRPEYYWADKSLCDSRAKTMIRDAYAGAFVWEPVVRLLEQLIERDRTFVESGKEFEDDDPEFYQVLLALKYALDEVMIPASTKRVAYFLANNPGYRSLYKQESGQQCFTPVKMGPRAEVFKKSRMSLVTAMVSIVHSDNADIQSIFTAEDALLELQLVVEKMDRKQMKDLSSLCLSAIAQAGLQASFRSQLRNYRPRVFSKCLGYHPASLAANKRAEIMRSVKGATVLLEGDYSGFPNLGGLADPAKGRFDYPAHRKRTKEAIETMRMAEKRLDQFWMAYDKGVKGGPNGYQLLSAMRSLFPSDRQHIRTPEWREPSVRHTPAGGTIGKARADKAMVDSLSRLSISTSSPPPKRRKAVLREVSERKNKTKNRGVAEPKKAEAEQAVGPVPLRPSPAEPRDNHQPAPASAPKPAPKPIFRVTKRTKAVFDMLFHRPSPGTLAGELDWREFLHAMDAVGFAATKLYGSAWKFAPTAEAREVMEAKKALSGQSTIIVHEPHPEKRIAFLQARRLGRRLERAYGLDAGCFVVEG
ncbi:hypothetical protein VTK26DRAFT_2609 [Humicola hyalothermophila]